MSTPYSQLRAQMSPEAQRQAEAKARALLGGLSWPCDACTRRMPLRLLSLVVGTPQAVLCPRCAALERSGQEI